MTYRLSLAAFALGAIVVAWAGFSFIGTNLLALTVTLAIAGAYSSGFAELVRYQRATATLNNALNATNDTVHDLDSWIARLHPGLHTSVRLRIQGEHLPLPQPVMTPYLVGLLVMLGMLGTFVGMVDTLKGAVAALEGTTELSAIRAGLAAPIKGLGMAFGTSVAGVAASAMLGFISTLSRRERMLASRLLDLKTRDVFQPYSLAHNRQQAFKAMQSQADTLPAVAARLEQLSTRLENLGEHIGRQLAENQTQFHATAASHFQELARAVGTSLQDSLAQSGRLAGESLQPIVSQLAGEISSMTAAMQQQTAAALQQQLAAVASEFSRTSAAVSESWQTGIHNQQQSQVQFVEAVQARLESLATSLKADSQALAEQLAATAASTLDHQAGQEQARFTAWQGALTASQEAAAAALADMARDTTAQIQAMTGQQQASLQAIAADFGTTATTWMEQWQTTSQGNLDQQQSLLHAMTKASDDIAAIHQQTSLQLGADLARLLAASEQLVEARKRQESGWMEAFQARMETLTTSISGKLEALHTAEAQRTAAAAGQMEQLQQVAREQLASLGAALEEPMGNLIRIASETPKAAAEVISQLRTEISHNIERDNALLEERRQIMADLQALAAAMAQSSAQQQQAIEGMVKAANDNLLATSTRFEESINSQLATMAGALDQFTGSAVELSSLGEAFGVAVELFSTSNAQLQEQLAQIQQALQAAGTRSDEQLAYYVAQAREIIDHGMLSQQEIISQIRQLGRNSSGEHA